MSDQLNEDFGGLFGAAPEAMIPKDVAEVYQDPRIYQYDYQHVTKDKKVYSALVRLLPNINNFKLSRVKTHEYRIKVADNNYENFICPSTLGMPSLFSKAYFTLKDHDDSYFSGLAPTFNRRQNYHSVCQIITDAQNPDLEGKMKILKYGRTLADLIDGAAAGNPALNKPGINVFDPFNGADLEYVIGLKAYDNGDKGPSYDNVKFTSTGTMTLWGADGNKFQPKDTPENRQAIYDYLKSGADLNLDDFCAKPWTQDDIDRAMGVLMRVIEDRGIVANIYRKTYGKAPKTMISTHSPAPSALPPAQQPVAKKSSEPVTPSVDIQEQPATQQPPQVGNAELMDLNLGDWDE